MKKKLLVVDDNPEIRQVMRRALEQAGHDVIEAADGHTVADWVEWEHPALVVMDIHMPRLDGITALGEILDVDPTMPVIIVTGDSDKGQAAQAMARGACDYITKPFDMRTLKASVAAHL
jgi:DNA-binding NtrC family response regulator